MRSYDSYHHPLHLHCILHCIVFLHCTAVHAFTCVQYIVGSSCHAGHNGPWIRTVSLVNTRWVAQTENSTETSVSWKSQVLSVGHSHKNETFFGCKRRGSEVCSQKMFHFCANATCRGLGFFNWQKFLSKFLSAQPTYCLLFSGTECQYHTFPSVFWNGFLWHFPSYVWFLLVLFGGFCNLVLLLSLHTILPRRNLVFVKSFCSHPLGMQLEMHRLSREKKVHQWGKQNHWLDWGFKAHTQPASRPCVPPSFQGRVAGVMKKRQSRIVCCAKVRVSSVE